MILPVESVAAVVEVKSSLGSKELRDATAGLGSVKALQKTGTRMAMGGSQITWSAPRPAFTALFAFGLGVRPRTFFQRWVEVQGAQAADRRIDLVCVLGELILVSRSDGGVFASKTGDDSLLAFTTLLLRELGEFVVSTTSLFDYVFTPGQGIELAPHPDLPPLSNAP